jgi:hypothetical protein
MSIILPGERVPVSHPNLKLGPGLSQAASLNSGQDGIFTTRAGSLNHSTNRAKWWVEGNSRRVRRLTLLTQTSCSVFPSVCPGRTGICDWHRDCSKWRELAGGHRCSPHGEFGWLGFRRRYKTQSPCSQGTFVYRTYTDNYTDSEYRLVPSFMLVCLWRTKIWNQS